MLQFLELFRALCDPFHYRVAGDGVNGSGKLLRGGQSTVWIFYRIRMILDPVGGEPILPVIKVGVLLREEDSVCHIPRLCTS